MKIKIEILILITLILNSSCSSIYRFSIDVQEPAQITLPVFAQNVIIINNTVPIPNSNAVEQFLNGEKFNSDSLSTDFMVWAVAKEIYNVLTESNFFNSVAIYNKSIREDSEWLSRIDLSQESQSSLYEIGDFNTLFVIDRLLFSLKQDVTMDPPNNFSKILSATIAKGMITCSMYYEGREQPLTTFSVSDYIADSKLYYFLLDSIVLFKMRPESILLSISNNLGNQAAKRFIPTWKTVERSIFVEKSPRMQEAAGFARNDKWEIAESIWTEELRRKVKPKDRAKIEFNLAVANEIQDKIDSAFQRTEKAKEYFSSVNSDKNKREVEIVDKYLSELAIRLQNNRLLDMQWGKEQPEEE